MPQVEFTHLMTGKKVVLLNSKQVAAYMHGDVIGESGKPTHVGVLWLILENVPSPIPVKETEEELKAKLNLT